MTFQNVMTITYKVFDAVVSVKVAIVMDKQSCFYTHAVFIAKFVIKSTIMWS